jgi:hypothetical protein
MIKRIQPLTRNRRIVLAVGTGVIALVTAIFLAGAPPLPAIVGAALAVAYLVWRARAA